MTFVPDFCFVDGFDHYTDAGDYTLNVAPLLLREYNAAADFLTSPANSFVFIGPALNGPAAGCSLRIHSFQRSAVNETISKTLPGNYARSIGGFATRIVEFAGAGGCGIEFLDGATVQFSLSFNLTTGTISARRGDLANGAVIATSTESVAVGAVAELEWDITFHNSTGIIKVWLNGGLCANLNLTGQDTCATANNYHNGFGLGNRPLTNGTFRIDFDHLYLGCYTAAGGGDAPLLYAPVIETQFGSSDDTAQFNVGPSVLGKDYRTTTATNAPGANQLVLRQFTPEVNATLQSVATVPGATSAAAKFKAVLYADSAGAPGALTATGTEVVGATNGATLTLPFAAGQALTGGTPYWIGFITDTSVALQRYDSTTTTGQIKANTYGSGAPNPAGAMTVNQASWQLWGNMTAAAANYAQVNKREPSLLEYNTESVVGDKDLLNFPALSITPSAIALVCNRVCALKSDGGARTIDLPTKSGATTVNGSLAAQTPSLSLTYLSSNFYTDPNTGVAWLAAGVNGAKDGYDIAA